MGFSKDEGDVTMLLCTCEKAGSTILHMWQSEELLPGEAIDKTVAIVKVRRDEEMDEDSSRGGAKAMTYVDNVSEVMLDRFADIGAWGGARKLRVKNYASVTDSKDK